MTLFSDTIRGARLGWRWCDEINAFVRISDLTDGYLIDVRPPDTLPRKSNGLYRAWWEDQSGFVGSELRRLIAGDLHAVRARRPIIFQYPGSETDYARLPETDAR